MASSQTAPAPAATPATVATHATPALTITTYTVSWRTQLDERAQKLLPACENYANLTPDAGLPGHYLMLLVSLQAKLLDDYELYIDQLEARPGTDLSQDRPSQNPHEHIQHSNGWPTKAERTQATMQQYREPATPKQLKAIYAIAYAKHGWSDDQTEEESRRLFEGLTPAELTKAQASSLIDQLKA